MIKPFHLLLIPLYFMQGCSSLMFFDAAPEQYLRAEATNKIVQLPSAKDFDPPTIRLAKRHFSDRYALPENSTLTVNGCNAKHLGFMIAKPKFSHDHFYIVSGIWGHRFFVWPCEQIVKVVKVEHKQVLALLDLPLTLPWTKHSRRNVGPIYFKEWINHNTFVATHRHYFIRFTNLDRDTIEVVVTPKDGDGLQ
ncbi:MAG: hypothetical protein R3183_00315 [Oleiphilaceae bacterium]|nr:hypothetical protein [Oleiphilaceae bacterium]